MRKEQKEKRVFQPRNNLLDQAMYLQGRKEVGVSCGVRNAHLEAVRLVSFRFADEHACASRLPAPRRV